MRTQSAEMSTLEATLLVVSIAVASVTTVPLLAQGEEGDQDVFVTVYKKASEARAQAARTAPEVCLVQ